MIIHLLSLFRHGQLAMIAASIAVCIAAAYAAAGVSDSFAALPANEVPMPLAAIAGGLGLAISASQYALLIALLPTAAVQFAATWTILSVAVAIGGSGVGLWYAGRGREQAALGGGLIGLASAATYMCSFAAIAAPAEGHHHVSLALSAMLAGTLFCSAALAIPRTMPGIRGRVASACLLTTGIFTLFLFSDIAIGLQHTIAGDPASNAIAEHWIAVAVMPTAIIVLILAVLSNGLVLRARLLTQTRRNLEQALREAEQAKDSRARFLAHMSHELRTPLNAIIGFSDLMEREALGQLGARYREYAEIIHDSGSHLLSMINQVLDIAKIDAGRLTLQEQEMDIAPEIDACARLMTDQMARKNIAFSLDIPPQLPRLYADVRIIRQIVLNLLGNAAKFTPDGGGVRLSAHADRHGLSLTVSDTGIGIAAADLDKAFERFGQMDNAYTRSHNGTGLGLPLVKEFVEAHQGTITLDSTLGDGTTVAVVLPAARLRQHAQVTSTAA